MSKQFIGKLVTQNGKSLFLNKKLTIGRSSENDLQLSDDTQVSRQHAYIDIQNGQYWIYDMGGANGTFVNGVRIPSKTLQPLQHNSEIKIGHTVMQFQLVSSSQSNQKPHKSRSKTPALQTTMIPLREGKKELLIGRDKQCDITVPHPQVSRHHARILRRGRDFIIEDLGSANGTFVNRKRVMPGKTYQLNDSDKIYVGPNKLIFHPNKITMQNGMEGMRLDALNLEKNVPNTNKKGEYINLIQNISLSIKPREFVVLVGVSGAGKSTMMNTLNGFSPANGKKSKVLVNGDNLYDNFDNYRSRIGYVPQDDIIHLDLTVKEALDYAAELRLPDDTSLKERDKRVKEVISQMRLTGRETVIVGNLSGGQRKRVSIGVELLSKPTLLFLDEPTSGLDPGTETLMMKLMRDLADEGHTILMVTHATQNVKLCDKVVFMASGGYMGFFGKPEEAMDYFKVREFTEIYDKLEPPEEYNNREKNQFGAGWGARFKKSKYYHQNVQQPQQQLRNVSNRKHLYQKPKAGADVNKSSWLKQFWVLSNRYYTITSRDKSNLIILLAQAPLIGIFIDVIFGPNIFFTQLNQADPSNVITVLFLLTTVSVWFGTSNAAKEIIKENAIYKRERMVNLKIGAYLASKVVILFALSLIQTILLMTVVMVQIKMPADRTSIMYLQIFLTLIFTTTSGMMLGLFVSSIVKTTDTAISIVPILLIPQIIFAGALFPFNQMGIVSQTFAYVTLNKWGFEGISQSVDVNRFFRDVREESKSIMIECEVATNSKTQGCESNYYADDDSSDRQSKWDWAKQLIPQTEQLLKDQGPTFNVHYVANEAICRDELKYSDENSQKSDLYCRFTKNKDVLEPWQSSPLAWVNKKNLEIRYEDWVEKDTSDTILYEDVASDEIVIDKQIWTYLLKSWGWLWGYIALYGMGAYIVQMRKDKRE